MPLPPWSEFLEVSEDAPSHTDQHDGRKQVGEDLKIPSDENFVHDPSGNPRKHHVQRNGDQHEDRGHGIRQGMLFNVTL